MKIGIISDTHGSLYGQALDALRGVDQILHAGDVGSPQVIEALQEVAPTKAVRGNTDGGLWCRNLPSTDMLEIDKTTIYLLHDLNTLDLDPPSAGIQVVVHGHTHQPASIRQDGVLYFNPGSASHRRHGAPLSVGCLEIIDGRIVPKIITLNP